MGESARDSSPASADASNQERVMGSKIELEFRVEQWSPSEVIERVFAICDRVDVGLAAFDAAVAAYPEKHITLRHGARVIRDNARNGRG